MSKKVASIFDNKESDDDHSARHQQAFFAGGSEHSGQQILGPERGANIVENLLNDARRHAELNPEPTSETLPVTFWRNGFTVGEDNELRDYESNTEFLTYLRRGEVPPELATRIRGGLVDVKLDNRAFQDYEPSKEKAQPFKGEGYRLGVPTPAVVSDGQGSSSSSSSTPATEPSQNTDASKPSLDEIRQARLARFGQKPKEPEK